MPTTKVMWWGRYGATLVRVGLNCVFLLPGETGGMEAYARELIPRLGAYGVEPVVFTTRAAAAVDFGVQTVVLPADARSRPMWVLAEQLLLPRAARAAGCELVHSLASTAPWRGRFRRVTTIHDLHYKTVPEAHYGVRAKVMGLLVPLSGRRSDLVLTDSDATRAELRSHLGLDATVVPLGVSVPADVVPTPEATLREQFGLRGRVVLTTGGTRPHKNVARLADAMAGLQDAVLVVTGYATPDDAVLEGRAQVVRTGFVSAEDRDGLYGLADVVAAPSLAEGFGLPVLEAMARGVPVACSASGSLGEVAGDAAATFDPHDVASIHATLARLLGDDAERARLAAAGRERAARFTWERTAELTAAAYATLL